MLNGTASTLGLGPRIRHSPAPSRSHRGKPSREQALEAVRTLLSFMGDDPRREGLLDTPDRVIRSYSEFFGGYEQDAEDVLARTFDEVEGYDDLVVVRDIPFQSHCEHHMVPFTGVAHVGYLPHRRVVGLSKLARVVDVYARRLQVQEKLTAQVADSIHRILQPRGVGVVIEASHECMVSRGVCKAGSRTITRRLTGEISKDRDLRREFLDLVAARPA